MTAKIRVNCQKTNLKKIRAFLRDCLSSESFSESDSNLLLVAVDEVCANLMIHGHNCSDQAFLEVAYTNNGKLITFEILDKGPFFNIASYKPPSIEKLLHERRNGGMGLILVKRIMDGIEAEADNGCNIYRMWKKLP